MGEFSFFSGMGTEWHLAAIHPITMNIEVVRSLCFVVSL